MVEMSGDRYTTEINPPVWLVSTTEDEWNSDEEFPSEAEAIAGAADALELTPGQKFFVGRKRRPAIDAAAATDVVDRLADHDDWYDVDCSDDLLRDIETASQDSVRGAELKAMLNDVFEEWLRRHGLLPKFFIVVDISEHITPVMEPTNAE